MPHRSATPVIVRVAGLPADTLLRFGTRLCGSVDALLALEAELRAARARLADVLYQAVPSAPPPLRRLLLAARRNAFNGRSQRRHAEAVEGAALCQAGGAALDDVLALEARHDEAVAAFNAAFAAAREDQEAALGETLRDPAFRRGLALASADLAQHGDPAAGRKARAALLRYVSRAAAKVSPFSTFTGVGVGAARDVPTPRLRGTPRRTGSLVRVKPWLLDPCAEMLRRWRPLRRLLQVEFAADAVEDEPGCFLVLRPRRWTVDPLSGALAFHEETLRAVTLPQPRLNDLRRALIGGPWTVGELASRLANASGEAEPVAAKRVEQLLEAGILSAALPWPAQSPHLEAEMLRSLDALPDEARPEAFAARLRVLAKLEGDYAASPDPVAALEAIKAAAEELWQAAAPLGGADPAAPRPASPAHTVYEDVFLGPGSRPGVEVLHLPRGAAVKALRFAEPLVRLASLFDRRHDLQRTLAALAERELGRADVGVLELFRCAQPYWRDYLSARARARGGDRLSAWNPLGLAQVDALTRARAVVWEGLEGCVHADGDEQRVSAAALHDLLDREGAGCATAEGGSCLFLQPADADGRRWVVNRLREGTGRFGSRYTPAMDPDTRRRYTRHLAARGALATADGFAELLDLAAVEGDTLNVHSPQTPAVLVRGGETAAPSFARRVRLSELRVTFRDGRATLRGPDGRALAPVFLGVAGEPWFSPMIRFLAAFGPASMAPVLPSAGMVHTGEVTERRRMVIGNLVLRRRGWTVDGKTLAPRLARLDEAGAFRVLSAWRAAHGIPDRVFLDDPTGGGGTRPQYLDLTSPLFAALFRAVVESRPAALTLYEALPDFGEMLPDGAGHRRAVEVLLDSLAFRPRYRGVRAAAAVQEARGSPAAPCGGGLFPSRCGSNSKE